MRIFIAGLTTETNSFSPMPTGRASFEEGGIFHGDATKHKVEYWTAPLHIWREMAEAQGWEVVESLCAAAQPSGPTVKAVFEEFRDEISGDLGAAGPVDVVLFSLHGAMIADGYDDCEGELIAGARQMLPDAVIGGLLDPHCQLTDVMMLEASLLVAYKEYPHVDVPERAKDLFRLAVSAAQGETRPVMRDWDCRMILGMATPQQPMRGFVDAMSAREGQDGVLSLSIAHSFPWGGDHPRVGARALAICDGDGGAQAEAEQNGWGARFMICAMNCTARLPILKWRWIGPRRRQNGRWFWLICRTMRGGGAPSDATFLLRAILERGMRDVAIGIFWDPIALRICKEAGEGATLDLRLGGKCGPMSGDPLDLRVTVRKIADGLTQRFGELPAPLGEMVWVTCEGVDIVINDKRSQTFHPKPLKSWVSSWPSAALFASSPLTIIRPGLPRLRLR